jgi:hypothetical protein
MRLKDKHRDEDHCHLYCVFFRVGFWKHPWGLCA